MENVRTRSITEERLLAPLLQFHDDLDIRLDDYWIDLELSEQSRDCLTDRSVADYDRTGVLHSFRSDFRSRALRASHAGRPTTSRAAGAGRAAVRARAFDGKLAD